MKFPQKKFTVSLLYVFLVLFFQIFNGWKSLAIFPKNSITDISYGPNTPLQLVRKLNY